MSVQAQSFIVPRDRSLKANTMLKMSLISAMDTFYQTFPFASAFATCGVKASHRISIFVLSRLVLTSLFVPYGIPIHLL